MELTHCDLGLDLTRRHRLQPAERGRAPAAMVDVIEGLVDVARQNAAADSFASAARNVAAVLTPEIPCDSPS